MLIDLKENSFIIHFSSVENPVENVQNFSIVVNNLETNRNGLHFASKFMHNSVNHAL